jgi:hypothetical protein
MQTVSASDALQRAKPLTETQAVDKGKIWLVLCGGAAGLFAATVLLENMSMFFPAIARANQAMAASKKAGTADDNVDPSIDVDTASMPPPDTEAIQREREIDAKSEQAVLAGLKAARERVMKDEAK